VKGVTRRHVLRGAGVALTLPWLESLAPRHARAQSVSATIRFVPIYFPLGIHYPNEPDFWTPAAAGAGAAWKLSPILEPLAPVKSRVSVLLNVDQTAFGTPNPEPGNGRLTGAYLTCAKVPMGSQTAPTNGVSIDQRIAAAVGVESIQVGLSTLDSFCDGVPCAYSRSISWSPQGPLYKAVSPQAVFDLIIQREATPPPALLGAAGRKSVLDFVLGNATSIRGRLGQTDRARMDQFLTSVRDLETRVAATPDAPIACQTIPRPTLIASPSSVPDGYDRDAHANLMVDLIVMALTCDAARIVSLMLDDARSDFKYDFLQRRHFTSAGSTPQADKLTMSPLVASANNGNSDPAINGTDQRATINWWYVSKVSALCQKLAAVADGPSASLLDNSVVWFGSAQQGENGATNLPLLYVGGGGGVLRTDRAVAFSPSQRLSNVYLTFLRHVFRLNDVTFGDSTGVITDLLV
jgi:hypothetical protein